jgi:type IV pilus assembly protein PilA
MRTIRNTRGFTLIELMIVVAILAILMAIAIPAYQDYTIRSQVSEGMSLAQGARAAVWDRWANSGAFPVDNTDAGLPSPGSIQGEYVSEVRVTNGQIQVTFGAPNANANISGDTLILAPVGATSDSSMEWTCDSGTLDSRYLPSRCR